MAFTKFHFLTHFICEKFRNCKKFGFRVKICKNTILNEKVTPQPHVSDISNRYSDFADEFPLFRLFCGWFRVPWPESEGFSFIPRGPHADEHYYHTKMTEQLYPRKNLKTTDFA